MTTNYYPSEEDWETEDWFSSLDLAHDREEVHPNLPIDILTLTAAILVIIGLVTGFGYIVGDLEEPDIILPNTAQNTKVQTELSSQPPLPAIAILESIAAPYDQYILTQGIHGQTYGHMAIDIAAGKGVVIKSPIAGVVSEYYFDAIGNPTLVIENELYRVTLLHGNYTVNVGEELNIGEPIGTESNLGNTKDMQGRSCRNRDCGYHTHLNVHNIKEGTNINPLEVINN